MSHLVLSIHLGSTIDEKFDNRKVTPLTDRMQRTASALKIITGNRSLRNNAECGICLILHGQNMIANGRERCPQKRCLISSPLYIHSVHTKVKMFGSHCASSRVCTQSSWAPSAARYRALCPAYTHRKYITSMCVCIFRVDKDLVHYIGQMCTWLTSLRMLKLSRSNCNASRWPFLAARCRGVSPTCQSNHRKPGPAEQLLQLQHIRFCELKKHLQSEGCNNEPYFPPWWPCCKALPSASVACEHSHVLQPGQKTCYHTDRKTTCKLYVCYECFVLFWFLLLL